MKRILGIILCGFVIFAISGNLVLAKRPLVEKDPEEALIREDPEEDLEEGTCESFNAEVPGYWGGEHGLGAVTAFPGDGDDAGYCTLTFDEDSKARMLEIRVLDGLADDSFEVYIENPAEEWVLAYSYTDQHDTETWVTHQIKGFPAGKGQGNTVEVKILPTGKPWTGFDTYGQLAVDYMAVYEH